MGSKLSACSDGTEASSSSSAIDFLTLCHSLKVLALDGGGLLDVIFVGLISNRHGLRKSELCKNPQVLSHYIQFCKSFWFCLGSCKCLYNCFREEGFICYKKLSYDL